MKYLSVLTEPIFSVRPRGHRRIASMPLSGVLATLSHRDDVEFPALQPHQRHAWYAFLVQLAALGLHHGKRDRGPSSFSSWTEMLLTLTKGKDEPFSLVADDLSKAAFLQCPVPEGTASSWDSFPYPDSLDVLVTAKNHDLKMARMAHPSPEHWVYALVSAQTMQGFWGRGHYGIVRMNSGIGSRACVTMAPSESWGDRFCRDVSVWLEQRKAITKGRFKTSGGLALLWLDPWDGERSIPLQDLDPFFIEACSRIRLVRTPDNIVAYRTHVKKPHIAAGESKGNTSEIWTPIRVKDGAALSLKEDPFSYGSVCDLLFGEEWKTPAALLHRDDDGHNPVILLQGLARAQGKTEGYHERVLHPSPESLAAFREPKARAALYEVAQKYLEAASTVRLKILKPGLLSLAQAAPERLNFDDDRARDILAEFVARVDERFFLALFSDVEGKHFSSWASVLARAAEELFLGAIRSLPIPIARRDRAVVLAKRVFYGSMRKHFPEISACPDDPEAARAALNLPFLDEIAPRRARVRLIAHTFANNTAERDLALLRRLVPGDLENETFVRLHKRLLHSAPDPVTGRRWTVIFRAMAILAGLHRRQVPMGRALAYSGYQESRLRALLSSRGEQLETNVSVLARWMYLRGSGFDHGDLADLVLSAEHEQAPVDESWSARVREDLAKGFYAVV